MHDYPYIIYRGFEIQKVASFFRIKGRPGYYTWLKDAKEYIDWVFREKKGQTAFHP